jgi:TRAP-type C4-dicarboxylate transport system permease small subunit
MQGLLHALDTWVRTAARAGLSIACISLIAITLIGTLDVITSAAWSRPLPSALELSEVLLAVAVFAALPYTQTIGQHVKVDLFTSRLGPAASRRAEALAQLATLAAMALMGWQAWNVASQSIALRETAAALFPFPIYPAKIVMVIGLALTVLEASRISLRLIFGPDPSVSAATERLHD